MRAFRARGFRCIHSRVSDQTQDSVSEIEILRGKIARLEERVRQLDSLAHQDALLPVPNRRGFLRELEACIGRVSRYGESAAMLFVDIDGLKRINDSFGHQAGDRALIEVARSLTEGVRTSDCVGRLGGDEFGVLLVQADEESGGDTAARLAERIESAQFRYEGNRLDLGVAIGVTVIREGDTPDAVIARADRAMYDKKSAAA
jgi:diguanylate cyclase (GGDEF)-like protein